MRTRIRALGPILALLLPATLRAAEPHGSYRQTVAEIMAAQQIADVTAGPRLARPRLVAPRWSAGSRPQSAASATYPAGAIAVAAPAPAAPQTLGVSFKGASLADTNAFPPDTMGAAGPTQFLVGVNGRIRTFLKSNGTADGVLNADMDVFFNAVRGGQPTTDPRVRYDRLSGKWVVTILNFNTSFVNNRLLIASSDTATITNATVWTYSYFQHDLDSPAGDTDLFLDYATLGVDANALVIGGDIFDALGNYTGTSVHVVRKSAALGGPGGDLVPAGSVVAFRNLTGTPNGQGLYSPQGVDNLADAAAAASWIIGVNNVLPVTSQLVLRKVSFSAPGAWPPTGISSDFLVSVPATALPLTVPHQGNAIGPDGMLDALDDRLFDARLRNGHIWTAHNIAVDNTGAGSDTGDRDGSRWYEIDVTGTPSLVQSGTLFDSAASNPRFYWIPSIAVSGQGHAALGSSASGATQRINAATAGRLSGDAAGTLQAPLLYTASSTSYNPAADPGPPRRWGDYSFTCLDPNDDMTMWTIQQYNDAVDSYGLRVVQLVAPPPAIPASAAPPAIPGGVSSVTVVLTGAATAGSGFFDPGAGYPNRLQVALSGTGGSVNSVVVDSPTSLTIDLNTIGAALGARTVTVTNPDGQTRTSTSAILTISANGAGPTVTAITPTSGDAGGGTPIQITGTDFASGAGATVGGADASGVDVTSATTADATTPALPPGTLNDVTIVNPDTQSGTLPAAWLADFTDVPQADIFHGHVEKLLRNGITAGCGGGLYCRNDGVTREQMAVLLLKGKLGAAHVPPACGGVFTDVACPSLYADWIEELHALGITGGCQASPLQYCPGGLVTRAQMAAFLLKADLGSAYNPPACAGTVFTDVPCTGGLFDPWIEDLASRGITGGCGAGAYCPSAPNTRGQMAVFLVKTFSLP